MGVITVLDECFDKGVFFLLCQEAYPMVSLFSEGDFRHHFQLAPLYGGSENTG